MIRQQKNKAGFTIIEISIALIIFSILLVAVLNIYRSSLSGSQKGMANLANMETATILMAQIEYDMIRAYKAFEDGELIDFSKHLLNEDGIQSLDLYVKTDDTSRSNLYKVSYYRLGDNFAREFSLNGTQQNKHIYGKGLKTELYFKPVLLNEKSLCRGFYVTLTVSALHAKTGKPESFTLKRLILCQNMLNPAELH